MMLDRGTDLLYRNALATSHSPYVRVEVWRGDELLEDDLTFTKGRVSARLTSRVTRTLSLEVNENLYPFEDDDLLAPFGNEIRAYRGIIFADGERYVWPVFVGKIVRPVLSDAGDCTVEASDRSKEVQDVSFTVPENSNNGAPVVDEVKRLISDALPGALFGTSDTFFQSTPILSWEHDRAQGLDELATSVGAFWYALADGRFVLRKVPWTVPGDPIATFRDGPGGSVSSSSAVRDRDQVFNSVTVTGERMDNTTPVFYTAQDENPDSPTYVLGPFGIRNKLVRLETPSTQDMARDAAEDYLRRTTAFTEAWTFSCSPDAALELGDVIRLDVRGRENIIQVVEGFDLPLDLESIMQVQCRAQAIGLLEGTS